MLLDTYISSRDTVPIVQLLCVRCKLEWGTIDFGVYFLEGFPKGFTRSVSATPRIKRTSHLGARRSSLLISHRHASVIAYGS